MEIVAGSGGCVGGDGLSVAYDVSARVGGMVGGVVAVSGRSGWCGCRCPAVAGQVRSARVCTRVNAAASSVVHGHVAARRQMRLRPVVMIWPAVWNRQ